MGYGDGIPKCPKVRVDHNHHITSFACNVEVKLRENIQKSCFAGCRGRGAEVGMQRQG